MWRKNVNNMYVLSLIHKNVIEFSALQAIAQCLTWYYEYLFGYLLGSIQRFSPGAAWETLVNSNYTNENILRYRC
jgi:hypothetical protein